MNSKKITQKDLNKVNWRWMYSSAICWNYERMMSTGYIYSMLPVLEKLYGDDEQKLNDMLTMHNQFFNTSPQTGSLILGIDIALEEKQGHDALEAVSGLKTGLMGPLAAIGDSLFGAVIPTIFGAIGAYMALEGSPVGAIIWLIANIVIIGLRWPMLNFAYKKGTDLVSSMSGQLKAVTDAATLLGITVVGALVATTVRATVPYVFTSGEVTLNIQESLDQIMPSLIPVIMVAFVYWLLGRKKMNSTKVIWLMLILSIVLHTLGILA